MGSWLQLTGGGQQRSGRGALRKLWAKPSEPQCGRTEGAAPGLPQGPGKPRPQGKAGPRAKRVHWGFGARGVPSGRMETCCSQAAPPTATSTSPCRSRGAVSVQLSTDVALPTEPKHRASRSGLVGSCRQAGDLDFTLPQATAQWGSKRGAGAGRGHTPARPCAHAHVADGPGSDPHLYTQVPPPGPHTALRPTAPGGRGREGPSEWRVLPCHLTLGFRKAVACAGQDRPRRQGAPVVQGQGGSRKARPRPSLCPHQGPWSRSLSGTWNRQQVGGRGGMRGGRGGCCPSVMAEAGGDRADRSCWLGRREARGLGATPTPTATLRGGVRRGPGCPLPRNAQCSRPSAPPAPRGHHLHTET